jgi:hypothetical protein
MPLIPIDQIASRIYLPLNPTQLLIDGETEHAKRRLSFLTIPKRRFPRSQCALGPRFTPGDCRRNALVEQNDPVRPRRSENSLFSVMGQKATGRATALIIAAVEADAEYYALHDLGFVTVSATTLVSDSVYWNRD